MAKKQRKATEAIGYRAIAKRYDVSTRTIQDWVAAGMPHDGPARRRVFVFAKTDPWVESYRKEHGDSEKATEQNRELKDQRIRILRAKADEAEREEERKKGNILERDELTLTLREIVGLTRDRLLTEISREIAKSFPRLRRKIFEITERKVSDILADFARDLEQVDAPR